MNPQILECVSNYGAKYSIAEPGVGACRHTSWNESSPGTACCAVAYSASSDGIFKALQTFGAILGHPSTWPAEGVAIVAKEVQGRRGFRFLTIKLA